MGKTKIPFSLQHFDVTARYDVYFESAQRLVALRDVRMVGLRTWEEFDEPDEAADTFLALQAADDRVVFVEASAVTMVAAAGTPVALEPVPI